MGYVLAFITIVLWSLNIVLAKYFSADILPFQLSLGRWAIAALILLPFSFSELWHLRHLIVKKFLYIITLAVLGIVLANTLLYFAAQTLQPTNIGILQITSPLLLTFLSVVFLKAKLNRYQIIGTIIAIIGVLEVVLHGKIENIYHFKVAKGDEYMLFFAFSFATYSFLQLKRPKEFSQIGLLSITCIVGTILLLPITYTTEGLPHLSKKDWELLLYLGVFNSIIAFLFWNTALTKIGEIKTGMFFYLMPFLTAILSYILFHEKITSFEILGGGLIIVGILTINFTGNKKTHQKKKY